MNNIIDYIREYKDITFKEHPFNEVDALVLSQFSYLKWEHVIPRLQDNDEGITLTEMSKRMLDAEVFVYERFVENNRAMWAAMLESKRYSTMKCNYLSVDLNRNLETQFMAFVAFPDDSLPVIVYRGTDETLLGWKEDYNMALNMPIVGQNLASLYLKQVALRLDGKFNIAGHSKGGNLAAYSAMDSSAELRERINIIYDFDGPHFRPELLEKLDYEAIKPKLHKFIPQSSVIGILLETDHYYTVIKSDAYSGIQQHDPFMWVVKGSSFKRLDKVNKHSIRLNEKMIELLWYLTIDQVYEFGRGLFEIVGLDKIYSIDEIEKKSMGDIASAAIKNISDIDMDTRKLMREVIKEFIKG